MKKPLEDFVHQSGRYIGKLNQVLLQTGYAKGTFTYRDEHPIVEGLAFAAYCSRNGEIWSFLHNLRHPIKKNEKLKNGTKINNNEVLLDDFVHQNGQHKGRLNQRALQTGSPRGTYTRGDDHPLVDGLKFRGYEKSSREIWFMTDQLEGILAYEAEYRSKNKHNIKRKKEKFLQKIQHIYDWKTTEQGKAKIATDKRESTNRRQRERLKDPTYRAIQYKIHEKYRLENVEKLQDYRREKNIKKRKQRTESLNEFYLTHDIPEHLWHESEFAVESDLQTSLEHVIVKKLGLEIERWTFLEEYGIPDIYIRQLDIIVEVKLLASMWKIDDVIEQSLRYSEISSTVIVSLDGAPKNWNSKSELPPWFTPNELFDFLSVIKNEL